MKKVLVHNQGNRQYRSLIKLLSIKNKDIAIQSGNLHGNLFDLCYIHKPDILLYPFVSYTQEVHNYIENNHQKHKIILYVDTIIENTQLVQYLKQTNCKYIVKNNTTRFHDNDLLFEYLYDDTIYYLLPENNRNNKIAVSLSNNNEQNKTILEQYIYPNKCNYDIVLFNNPEFNHPQNVGIYNEQDLNYVLNTYKYFLDIDKEFPLESAATNSIWINPENDFITQINSKTYSNIFTNNYEKYKCTDFVTNKLIPYLGI